jgi:D-glycerate 3-kinase
MSRAERTDKILSRVLPSIRKHQELLREQGQQRPFILALTGLQGCGKSTLATDIVNELNEKYNCRSIEVSLDDFYLTHAERQKLRTTENGEPGNALLKTRGQPGTHDCVLARTILDQFSARQEDAKKSEGAAITLPIFDKSLFNGDGDRLPREQWRVLGSETPIEVLVFEGWCVGFQPLSKEAVNAKWMEAKNQCTAGGDIEKPAAEQNFSTTTLANHKLDDLLFVNSCLEAYCEDFMGPQHFDFLIHLDTTDLVNVYRWRMEQEHMLKKVKGTGMTDDQVIAFGKLRTHPYLRIDLIGALCEVQGYMPAYELYLDQLRQGFFKGISPNEMQKGHLHVILDKARQLIDIQNV